MIFIKLEEIKKTVNYMSYQKIFLAKLTNTSTEGAVDVKEAATSNIKDVVYSMDTSYDMWLTKEGAWMEDENTIVHCLPISMGTPDDRVQCNIRRVDDNRILIQCYKLDVTQQVPGYWNNTTVMIIVSSSNSA